MKADDAAASFSALINAPVPQPALFVTEIYMYCISFSMLHMCLEEELISR